MKDLKMVTEVTRSKLDCKNYHYNNLLCLASCLINFVIHLITL